MLDRRLVIVSGKGGVGKSAVAAALALAGHRQGQKVLAISMLSPGGGLAAHLGGPPLRFEPTEVRPGMSALVVDRAEALTEYLKIQLGIPQVGLLGPALRAFDALASAAPAIREIVTMGKVLWEVRRGVWDLVVADAPPTGQIASYLRAARTITELVPAGRIREQAAWMEELAKDPEATALCLVTLAEELPASETAQMVSWLDSESVIAEHQVVANRILPELEVDADALPSGKAGEAARLHLSLRAEQQRWLEVVPAETQLPFLFGLFTPAEVAARLADEVETW